MHAPQSHFMAHALPMTTPQSFKHKDYELHCSAKLMDSGKFAPVLVVAKQAWPSRPRTIAVRDDGFQTEASAIDAAHARACRICSQALSPRACAASRCVP